MHEREKRRVFENWIARHEGLLFKVVRTFSDSPHDRDDLFQQIALQLWKSIPSYSSRVAETTWIYRVAFYAATAWSRKERNRQRVNLLGDDDRVLAQVDRSIDNRLDALLDQIAALPDVDRSLALMLLDGLSYRSMAQVLGISESHVGVRIHRIKKQLIQGISREDTC
ncbi:MAG: sigma-70 family RNA polymerase sigma factor [Planctomycetota bacterium]